MVDQAQGKTEAGDAQAVDLAEQGPTRDAHDASHLVSHAAGMEHK